jgi:hypothetical protein
MVCAGLAGAQSPLPGWSEREVLRVVTDSPWAKRSTVPIKWKKEQRRELLPRDIPGADPVYERTRSGGPLGGIGAPPKDHLPNKADLILRWASALPVRQAKAIYTKKHEQLEEFGRHYTLEIYGIPSEVAHLGAASVEGVAVSGIVLRTKSGRMVKPVSADARVQGTSLTLYVHFPRTEALSAEDDFIQVDGDMQVFRFTERFLLKKMEYQGRLEM